MNAVNHATTAIFDVLLVPFELLGAEAALVLASGLFGIVALIVFKHISWQRGIKGAKDRIKGHMIAIRIYQDDLKVVGTSVGSIIGRNVQYLSLNLMPIVPLAVPFVLAMAQFVVRYGFEPLPITETPVEQLLPGQGTTISISMKAGRESAVGKLELKLPEGLRAMSPLVRNKTDGVAFQEVVATRAGEWELELLVDGQRIGTKSIVTGDAPARLMQPERTHDFWASWLWPAEDTFASDSPLARVSFAYPERDLGWLPGGPLGILITFFVSSMAFGILILKPLNIQI
jgi:hypothetical protein